MKMNITAAGCLELLRNDGWMEQHITSEPLFSKNAQNNHKPLYMAAIKRFGNWGKALQSAGVDYKSVRLRRNMTKAEIKKEVLALFRSGISLSYMNMRANYMYLQAAAMKKLGDGSWARARCECGILTNYRLKKDKKCFTL
jgi:hypothetical protein